MSLEETVTLNLELDVGALQTELRQLELVLFRSMGYLRRFSGSEQVDAAISKIQRLIMTVRLLHRTIQLMYAASGPIGWAMLGLSVVGTVVSMGDFVTEIRSTG